MFLLAACVMQTAKSVELSFTGVDGVHLKGTYEAPADGKGMKAMLLIPGSGPTDRDGNQPPSVMTDLLKQIADNLAAHGVATFRFDKRAAHVYAADFPKDTSKLNAYFAWDKFTGDAAAAFNLLKKQPGVDPAKVGILGHSEGTMIALQVAHDLPKAQKPYALVLIGLPGRNMGDVIENQIDDTLHRQTTDEKVIKSLNDSTKQAVDQIRDKGTLPEHIPLGLQALFNPTVVSILQSYFLFDTPAMAKAYPGPVLLMNGGSDVQVSATKDFPIDEAAFRSRPNGILETMIVPGASHNLKHVTSPNDPAFAGPAAPEALDRISAFLKRLP